MDVYLSRGVGEGLEPELTGLGVEGVVGDIDHTGALVPPVDYPEDVA